MLYGTYHGSVNRGGFYTLIMDVYVPVTWIK
jgi:hypothetical protein